MEEELDKRAKKEGRGALWKRRSKRGTIIRVRVDDRRDSSVILGLQVQRKGVAYRRQPGARGDPLLEVERVKLVWMQRKGGTAQRGKGAAERCTVRRTRKHSKRKRKRRAHREEKHSKRGG